MLSPSVTFRQGLIKDVVQLVLDRLTKVCVKLGMWLCAFCLGLLKLASYTKKARMAIVSMQLKECDLIDNIIRPFFPIKVELLVSEESSCFSHNPSEI